MLRGSGRSCPSTSGRRCKDPAKYTNTKPVGTGPFTLDKFAPTQYTLKKNPDYWQADKIAPDEVVLPAQSTNQSTNQLDVTSGKFDWSYNYLPDVEKTYVSRDKETQHLLVPTGRRDRPVPEPDQGAVLDVDFRKGVSLAIDRDTIADKAVNGYADRSQPVRPDPAQPGEVARPVASPTRATSARTPGRGHRGVRRRPASPRRAASWSTRRQAGDDVDHDAVELQRLGRGGARRSSTSSERSASRSTIDPPQRRSTRAAIQSGKFDVAFGGYGGTGDPVHRLQQHAEQRVRRTDRHRDRQQLRAVQGPEGRRRAGHAGRGHRPRRSSRRHVHSWSR